MKKWYLALFIIGICFNLCLFNGCHVKFEQPKKITPIEKKLNGLNVKYLFSIYNIKVYKFHDSGSSRYMFINEKDIKGIPENIRIEENKNE